jgi:hypothetical protein
MLSDSDGGFRVGIMDEPPPYPTGAGTRPGIFLLPHTQNNMYGSLNGLFRVGFEPNPFPCSPPSFVP